MAPLRSRSVVTACVTAATFTDLVAYSVAVPVLPDYASRFGATPGTIGVLFASFGLTLLLASLPMGVLSDRLGRKPPMLAALALLSGSTLLFGYAPDLTTLFAARMLQGVADALTWVVGLAMIADLYPSDERGGAMGIVMSGSVLGGIVGPSLGGWLYELGGIRLPFLCVAGLAAAALLAFALFVPDTRGGARSTRVWTTLGTPAVARCVVAVVAAAATMAMLEPVLPLHFEARLGFRPATIGVVFGVAALASSVLHPIYGRLSDRWGGGRLMVVGLALSGAAMPFLVAARGPVSAAAIMVVVWAALGLIVTPSLAYMAQALSAEGVEAYGAAYGLYNVAWAVGLMSGPSLGGFLLQTAGFRALTLGWAAALAVAGAVLARSR